MAEGTTAEPVAEVPADTGGEAVAAAAPVQGEPGELSGVLQSGETWSYRGGLADAFTKQGTGLQSWGEGLAFNGTFERGLVHGRGRMAWPSGEVYEGEWVESQMEGQGKLTFQNGSYYEGAFVAGKFHGKGKLVIPNVATEAGEFVQGSKLNEETGDVQWNGEWENGVYVPPPGEGGKDKKKKKK